MILCFSLNRQMRRGVSLIPIFVTPSLGALLGDDVVLAGSGTWVFKPRGQWHTFWNPGDTACEIIEIISPASFENYFREVAGAWGKLERFQHINAKHNLDMDFDSIPRLCERFGLTFPVLETKVVPASVGGS
jgi:hypothetical protein